MRKIEKVEKALVFDMDGTLCDLYGVNGWLADLRNEDVRPYAIAEPFYNMKVLNEVVNRLKTQGWKIIVTTWLAKESSDEYKNETRITKKAWLDLHQFPYDDLHMVQYGTTKANCTRVKANYQILVDDNEKVCKGWKLGDTIDANGNIILDLRGLLA